MKNLLSIILIFILQASYSQEIRWEQCSGWHLYKTSDKRENAFPADSLYKIKNIFLNDDSVKYYLKSAASWPKDKTMLWMGFFILSCSDNAKKLHKVDVSLYGGFFFDEVGQRYYEIQKEKQDAWLQYLNDNMQRFAESN